MSEATGDYMPMFLAEAREHIQELDLAVVALEADPTNRAQIDGVFRTAHSLKGTSATMGFAAMAELTHVMEDVFELLRQRAAGLREEAVTAVFACLDALRGAVESIERGGGEDLDPAPLITQLQALIRNRTPEQAVARAGGALLPDAATLQAARADGGRILHVQVKLAPAVLMPAVRAYMVFAALSDHGELLGGIPAPDAVESFAGHEINAWIVSEHEHDDLAASAARVSEVAGVEVVELAEDAEPPAAPLSAEPLAEPDEGSVADEAPASGPAPAKPASPSTAVARTVRVDAERLDALMHLVAELVIHRTVIEARTADLPSPELQRAVQDLARSSRALQTMVMEVRMVPVEVVFNRFPRLVRDLSTQLHKDVELELVGGDTKLDRSVVDALGDPLMHLVRNALDHGIEPPEVRIAAGKRRTGQLTISARQAAGNVVIEVRDDGRGVNPQVVGRRAVERGLIDARSGAELDLRDAIELMFAPGFSTTVLTNDISGRGVGMDAVRARIRELGGEVSVQAAAGVGMSIEIVLPLTLAITPALQVDVAGGAFAIPIERVERTLRLTEHVVRSVGGRPMLVLDDGAVPLLEGAAALGRAAPHEHGLVVIVRGGEARIGLTVDAVTGRGELVTRPLSPSASSGRPVSGSALLADGHTALIIDCDALAAGLTEPMRTIDRDLVNA